MTSPCLDLSQDGGLPIAAPSAPADNQDSPALLLASSPSKPQWPQLLLKVVALFLLAVAALSLALHRDPDAAAWILFGEQEDEADLYQQAKAFPPLTQPSPPTRVLYVLTSSSNSKGGKDRVKEKMVPVLQNGVGSFYGNYGKGNDGTTGEQGRRYHVDVYLILSYQLTDDQHHAIRTALPPTVGLQVWDDALPMDYVDCDKNLDQTPFEEWNNTLCNSKPIHVISGADVALARQHRYVMKDKLPYYDMFISLEDDMRVTRHHVETHLRTMEHIRKHTPNSTVTTPASSRLTKRLLERIRPGFVRVEVLQDELSKSRVKSVVESSKVIARSIPMNESAKYIETNWCCGETDPNATVPPVDSVIAWETAIESLSVIHIGDRWYVAIPGSREYRLPDHWAGKLVSGVSSNQRPDPFEAKFLAQPAFWIMTRAELMQAHIKLCHGSFFPPYEAPHYYRNGLWRNNVEYWSGGIQMWCGSCNILRVMELDQFSRHLVWHTTNNKQYDIHEAERLIRMNELHAQLWSVVADAKMQQQNRTKVRS